VFDLKHIYLFIIVFQFYNTTGHPLQQQKVYINLFSYTVSVWCADGMFWFSEEFRGKSKAVVRPLSFKYTTKNFNMLNPKFHGVEMYV